ncbi:3-deoxy-manno-octulosonate-8-phosphatase KdsC [Candidatus Arsenophonus triatominarum]|uniref:3-deoxy-manno-octulosonate-8-phosphatase KdsC n=1 Tax=Candidatus Arsenophonus triatominarum TaxID=57911 RepID=UPI0007C51563|nr:3-deoxy-manno-octulosonate-8-phosphatase KdsC [Candidatus Arsenophonus triatominarum]
MNNGNKITTCYGPIDQHIVEKARLIKLLICDVDGVMTDGLIYMGNNGEELKAFNVKDGYGIRCLLTSAIEVAIITGRKAKLLKDRAKTLGINYFYQGQSEKKLAYNDLITRLKLQPQQIAYIGDDLIDWPVMSQIGLSVAVADAHPMLLSKAHYVTYQVGGKGAVREICDLILLAQDKIENAQGLSI